MPDPQKRINQLRRDIHRHNKLYYQEARPEIPDREFDALLAELIALEAAHPGLATPDSPSQRVGGVPIESFRAVEHAVRMMSIDNTYDEAAVREFDKRVRKGLEGTEPSYVLEPKVDGVACNLRYEDGLLVLAATRGDGRRGDDITHNVRTIHSVPLRLKGRPPRVLECRGEVFMPDEGFQKLNRDALEAGEEPFANPRNATAGTLKQLDPRSAASRRLQFVAHGLGQVEPLAVRRYWEWLELLRDLGLPTTPHAMFAKDIDEAIKGIEAFGIIRGQLGFQTDGMVVKVDDLAQRETLGETSKSPKWCIAFKYPAEQVQTVLHDVTWQVGKNGTLTPVAHLEPVFVSGSTVRRATLHNLDQIRRLGLHMGDTIVLEKAGEVIPYVVSAVESKRPRHARPVKPPGHCPACGTPVQQEAGTPYILCPNPDCPAQLKERLRWFVGRNQMDIEGLGEELVYQLVESGKVKTFADLYALTADDIAGLPREVTTEKEGVKETRIQRVGDVIAGKVLAGIEKSKSRGLARVLAGIGIPHVGATVSRKAAAAFGTLEAMNAASITDLHAAIFDNASDRTTASDGKNAAVLHAFLTGSEIAPPPKSKKSPKRSRPSSSEAGGGDDLFHAATPAPSAAVGAGLRPARVDSTVGLLAAAAEDPSLTRWLTEDRRARLAEAFAIPDDLAAATPDQILEALTAPVVATSLHRFLHSAAGKHTFSSLESAGVNLTESRLNVAANAPLAGRSVVITGTFRLPRKKIEEMLVYLGGKVSSSVSSRTFFVLVGTDPGSKYDDAIKLNISRKTEDEFFLEFENYLKSWF